MRRTGGFPNLDDLAGGAGRLDILCRCVTSALVCSHGIREDVRVHLVLNNQFTVQFDGANLKRLNPDERSTAALIRTALENREKAIGHMPAESTPGVSIRRMGFAETVNRLKTETTPIQLHETGTPIVDIDPPDDPLFVLSDHHSLTNDEIEQLGDIAEHQIRLGPMILHADHAITIAHNYLDTNGYNQY
jgi:tRNA (pseudouridine54-N1)-methyltransferase